MFKTVLNSEINKLKKEKIPFNLESGIFDSVYFSETSGTIRKIPLGNSILLVKKIIAQGPFSLSSWDSDTDFFTLVSKGNEIEYKTFDYRVFSGMANVFSELPSIHKVELKILYTNTNFVDGSGTGANIHRLALEYIKINPLAK
jgi:hypothetical protein